MKKLKILFILILSIFAIATVALLSIQGVDYIVHFKTYSQIDKFFEDIKMARENDNCYINYASLFHNGKKVIPQKIRTAMGMSKKSSLMAITPEMYDKVIISCTQFKNDLSSITVSKDLPNDKQILLKQYRDSTFIVVDSLLNNLVGMKKCSGDIVCINDSRISNDKKYSQKSKLIIEGNLAAIQAQKRLSCKYYFKLRPKVQQLEDKLTNKNKIIKSFKPL